MTSKILKFEEEVKEWFFSKITWSDEKAERILYYYVARRGSWREDEGNLWFYDNGMGWNFKSAKKYLEVKDYFFWMKYYAEIRKFLIQDFELQDFCKTVLDCKYGETWIRFSIIE